jgi:hypothetical protein
MLMIFGKYDEYRERMTGTKDFEAEWLTTPQTLAAFGSSDVQFDKTYGSFQNGTARRVHMTHTTHVSESFNKGAIAEAVTWFNQALNHNQPLSIPTDAQRWKLKEVASFIAMTAGILSTIPAGILFLGTQPFADLVERPSEKYSRDKRTFHTGFWINTGLTLLYLALIMVIFGLHVYVVPIDRIFPMMMVNGVVFWFVTINIIGFFIFKRWIKKNKNNRPEVNFKTMGLSESEDKIKLDWGKLGKTFLLAGILFAVVYLLQAGLEALFLIDFRYKFPYASDLTPYRALMMLLYFPFFLAGFLQMNILLQGQLRPKPQKTWWGSALHRSLSGIFVITVPLLLHMAIQYIPLFTTGTVPFIGPGGALVGFVINLEHMILIQLLMIPIGSFLYEATGKIYAGTILNALIVTWMFTSSSVIAPLPV